VDGFHPNREAHALWGEEIASLALPLLIGFPRRTDAPDAESRLAMTGGLADAENPRRSPVPAV
jgi:hypothetical protein